jgi:predicted permease
VLQPYQLAAIAAEPVVKVALLSGAGAMCAKHGILTLEGRRMLSGLIMNVFTPALVGAVKTVWVCCRWQPHAGVSSQQSGTCCKQRVLCTARLFCQTSCLKVCPHASAVHPFNPAALAGSSLPLYLMLAPSPFAFVLLLICVFPLLLQLLSKLGSSVSVALAISLWPLAANMVICHAVGLGIGWLQVQLAGIPQNLRSQTLVMNTAGNIGNLPLVLVPSLIASPDVLISAEGKEMAITYVMLGFFVASFIQFPCGYLLLQRPAAEQSTEMQQQQQQQLAPVAAAAAVVSATAVPPGALVAAAAAARSDGAAPSSALQEDLSPHPKQQQQQPGQMSTLAKGVFTPPVIACLLAIPVATVPELKEQLFTPTGMSHAEPARYFSVMRVKHTCF